MSSSKSKLNALLKKQKYRCAYCQQMLYIRQNRHDGYNTATLDHIKPKSKGGDGNIGNLVAACRLCNTLKSSSAKFDISKFELYDLIENGKVITRGTLRCVHRFKRRYKKEKAIAVRYIYGSVLNDFDWKIVSLKSIGV